MGLVISIGKYGGFYISLKSWSKRICIGWLAITFFPTDGDQLFMAASNWSAVSEKCREHDNNSALVTIDEGGAAVRPFVGEIIYDGE